MRPKINLTSDDYLAIERDYCQRSLSNFIKRAWLIFEPATPYQHNWHVDCISEHMEAVTHGEINRLLINIPPGLMKSTIAGVFHPLWEWGPKAMPHLKYITASHGQDYAIRDAMHMRRILSSPWFQRMWPTPLKKDQNEKSKFENESGGMRQAMAVSSMTGSRGHRILWDDPHSVEGAISESDRKTAIRIFKETLTTRLMDPEKSSITVVMQRLHQDDVSGYILANDLGYTHLCLPMEYSKAHVVPSATSERFNFGTVPRSPALQTISLCVLRLSKLVRVFFTPTLYGTSGSLPTSKEPRLSNTINTNPMPLLSRMHRLVVL
jgi:hypothetical protein